MDCSSSQSDHSTLGNRSFLRLGTYYLYVKPRAQPSVKLPSHQYPHNLKRAKAGTSSPEERDKRLYENFGLAQYELPFICLIYNDVGKNTFTIVIHDYQGQLNKQYETDQELKAQFLNSLQPSIVPTPISETPISEVPSRETTSSNETPVCETPDEAPITEPPITEPPITETPITETPITETPINDENVMHKDEDAQIEGTLSGDAQWLSVMLSHHLSLIQDQLELKLFEAKNQCRMMAILKTKEMEKEALVDNIRCREMKEE